MQQFRNVGTRSIRYLVVALLAGILALAGRPAVHAAGIVVNSAADIVADDGVCTLREAITAANSDAASGVTAGECAAGSGPDVITFAADYTITLVGSQLPVVNSDLTITGNGAANTIIQANAAANTATYRVFQVAALANMTLDGVTVRHGSLTNGSGGGILNSGTVTVTNSTLAGNSANGSGGGILTFGTLTVTNSTLSGNSAGNGGEISFVSGSISANAFNVFGHSGQSNADAFFNFTPGANDFNATTSGTPTALTATLDTALASNGGPTQTHALVDGSPAIDFAGTCGLATDQRGVARPAAACDAGAYEVAIPLAISLGWFMAEADGDRVDFRWQTVTETGTAGFNLLAVTADGNPQLNEALIPSTVIDSVTPTDYAYSAVTNATSFLLQEVKVSGGRVDHGPFAIGVESGEHGGSGGSGDHQLWLPLINR